MACLEIWVGVTKLLLDWIGSHWKWHHSMDRIGAYEFLFIFHCNYGGFRTKARYWSKNANFSYPLYVACTIP